MKKRAKKHALSFAALLTLVLGGGMQLYAADKLADTVYHNGKIYTVTETMEEVKNVKNAKKADVVATLEGRIVFVGSKSEAEKKGFFDDTRVGKVVDLRGKTMLPGFVDGHSHFPGDSSIDLYTVNLNCPPLGPVETMADLIALMKTKADATPDGYWVRGNNYDDSLIAEKRHPNRYDLDKASPTKPISVSHSSGHMSAVNSIIIEHILATQGKVEFANGAYIFKKNDGTYESGVDIDQSTGIPTGVLREAAASLSNTYSAKSMPSNTDWLNARGSQKYSAAGVTTVDVGGTGIASAIPGYQQAIKEGLLNVRVVAHPSICNTANHKALKWDLNGTESPTASNKNLETLLDDKPTAESPKMGADLTKYKAPNAVKDVDMSGQPDNRVFLGAWKQFYDGSPQGYTALFKRPGYWDKQGQNGFDPETNEDLGPDGPLLGLGGTSKIPFQQLVKSINLYHQYGQSVETHTNGPLAAESMMTAIELAVASNPGVTDTRHTFIHGQTEERQVVERAAGHYENLDTTAHMYTQLNGTALQSGTVKAADGTEYTASDLRAALDNGALIKSQNLLSSYFINHTYFWGDRHYNIYFGPGRAKMISPAGWASYFGHRFTSHNDTPVTPISPLRSVNSFVNRVTTGGMILNGGSKDITATAWYPETKGGADAEFWDYDQRVNALQGIHATTINPAYQNKIDDRVGSIEEGKLADFTILDLDPLEVAETAPLTLADIRVATTIVDDKVIYGILPDSESMLGQLSAGYNQPDGVTVRNLQYNAISKADAEKNYGAIDAGDNRLGTMAFTAEITEGKSGVFQLTFLGNGMPVESYQLYKLHDNDAVKYQYGKPAAEEMASASGRWWVMEMETLALLAPTDILERNKTYIAFFVIRDNDGIFDLDAAPGIINDPIAMTTVGSLPDNGNGNGNGTAPSDDGGSSSGCTVGSTPSYDLLVLLLGMSAVAAVRVLRRRND